MPCTKTLSRAVYVCIVLCMAFRANEAATDGRDQASRHLVPRDADAAQRKRSQSAVDEIIDSCGPIVDQYPTWHPLLAAHNPQDVVVRPGPRCGYAGLDHTVFFRNGFITCPYNGGREVIESVEQLPPSQVATINAEPVNEQLYHPDAKPVLVRCEWSKPLPLDGMIPKSLAVPLMLEQEVPCWRWSEFAETWESMQPYFLGTPHGSRSSLFVNQETGQVLKKIWNALIYTGMFGPIKV